CMALGGKLPPFDFVRLPSTPIQMIKRFKGTPAQERTLSAYVKLERAAGAAFAYARVGLEEEGLTLSQFAVLEALYHLGPLFLGDLARRILTSSGNLTLVIDNLQ